MMSTDRNELKRFSCRYTAGETSDDVTQAFDDRLAGNWVDGGRWGRGRSLCLPLIASCEDFGIPTTTIRPNQREPASADEVTD